MTTTTTTTTTAPPPSSTPTTMTQTVVFLRHGVAEHNVHGANLTSPSLWDPSLTLEGKVSSVRAGERIKQWLRQQQKQQQQQQSIITSHYDGDSSSDTTMIDLIVCSPLSRTLQTAALAFVPDPPYITTTTTTSSPLLVVCVEAVREAYGMHYPDKRRKISVLRVCTRVMFNLDGIFMCLLIIQSPTEAFSLPVNKSYSHHCCLVMTITIIIIIILVDLLNSNNGRRCTLTNPCPTKMCIGLPRNEKPSIMYEIACKPFCNGYVPDPNKPFVSYRTACGLRYACRNLGVGPWGIVACTIAMPMPSNSRHNRDVSGVCRMSP